LVIEVITVRFCIGTDSSSWGPIFIAAERALTETAVTPENEKLLRTHHRSLARSDTVEVGHEINGKEIWLVSAAASITVLDTHAGGREIHIMPRYMIPDLTGYYARAFEDPIGRELNPRRFLTARDLNHIRNLFPHATGVRVLICGIVIILFRTGSDMRLTWERGGPDTIGLLNVGYDIAEHIQTRAEHWSYAVSEHPDDLSCSVCLGLRLKLANGQEAITTATHGFVELETSKNRMVLCFADWYIRLKNILSRFLSIPTETDVLGMATPRELAGNSPLGKAVWLSGTNRRVSTLRHFGLIHTHLICRSAR